MARYSDDLISEICSENDIIDYVSRYVELKKSGRDYSGLCPFHHEKSPSFHVSQEKQLFHCFGCGASGNLVQFVMRAESLDFVDALKVLADRAGILLPERDNSMDDEKHRKKKRLYEMNKIAARFFYQQLTKTQDGRPALQYFAGRQISPKTINTYGLGYAPASYDALLNYLKEQGFSEEEIVDGSLAARRDSRVYDKFRDRVMFPIIDVRGNIIGFGGRIMTEIVKDGYKPPKYLNSSETIAFDKGRNLFSLNLAKNSDSTQMILVEGYMDVISVYQAGIPNVVATLGTALTENQAKLLGRYAGEILICYDSDEAGQKATLRAIDIISGVGGKSRVIKLKGAKDPDEYIKKNGVEAFRSAVKKSLPSTEYKLGLLKARHDLSDTDGRIQFVTEAAEALSTVRDAIEVDAYIKNVSEETQISKEAIYTEYKRKTAKSEYKEKRAHQPNFSVQPVKDRPSGTVFVKRPQTNRRLEAEKRILGLIVQDKKLCHTVREALKPEEFSVPVYQRLAKMIYDSWEMDKEPETAVLVSGFSENREEQDQAASVFYNMEIYDDKDGTVQELLDSIQLEAIEEEIRACGDIARLNELYKQRAVIQGREKKWEE